MLSFVLYSFGSTGFNKPYTYFKLSKFSGYVSYPTYSKS